MNDENKPTEEAPSTGKVPSRSAFYSMVSPYGREAVQTLVEAMRKGNWSVKTGAAKTLLAKIIPDLKSTELTGKDGEQLIINLVSDYVTSIRRNVSTPDGGAEGSIKIQGTDLAQESSEDINTTREDGTGVPQPVR